MNRFVDVGPFVDAGAVAASPGKLSARNVRATLGLRGAVRCRSRVLFHVDWGRSREGQRLRLGSGVLF